MELSNLAAAHMKVVAALAETAASKLEHHSFWPGELERVIEQIQKALDEAQRNA